MKIPCGSEPARDSGVSVDNGLPDTLQSRAGSLPQWFWGVHKIPVTPD
ncbi:hypothetical protein [Pseudomonas sp. FG-3G]|nr:hypothetical protein [Pseudomonas sp. FG-3G]